MLVKYSIDSEKLSSEAFEKYGQVIEYSRSGSSNANQGTAKRINWLAKLENLRPNAKPNMCVFRVSPVSKSPFLLRLLERHRLSSQAFIPMNSNSSDGYLVIVCLNGKDDRPDFSTLKSFKASSTQAINYKAGTWHHPIIALNNQTDFTCLVWEAEEPEDCEEVFLNKDYKGQYEEDLITVYF